MGWCRSLGQVDHVGQVGSEGGVFLFFCSLFFACCCFGLVYDRSFLHTNGVVIVPYPYLFIFSCLVSYSLLFLIAHFKLDIFLSSSFLCGSWQVWGTKSFLSICFFFSSPQFVRLCWGGGERYPIHYIITVYLPPPFP